MMIRAWRITKARHAGTAFTGLGARLYGGRWNRPGRAVVYTAGSVSLAVLEMLVHLEAIELLRRYVIFEVAFDDALVTAVDAGKLPRNWRKSPAPGAVRAVGDDWILAGKSAVLRVPSVVVPREWNYLLNPLHPDFAKIKIGRKEGIRFDPRLIKGSKPKHAGI